MHYDFTHLNPTDLTEEEKQSLEKLMADGQATILAAALRNYGKGEKYDCKRLQRDFRSGTPLRITVAEQGVLLALQGIESKIISGYVKAVIELANAFFYSKSGDWPLEVEDYVQEGMQVLIDCIYTYRGVERFSTFAYAAVKHRFIDIDRSAKRKLRAEWDLISSAKMIRRKMRTENLEFERAITMLEETGRPLDGEKVERCRRTVLGETDSRPSDDDFTLSSDLSVDSALMRRAVAETPLDDDQRYLLTLHSTGEIGWQTRLAKEQHKSKAAISQQWQTVCRKIRASYERLNGGQRVA